MAVTASCCRRSLPANSARPASACASAKDPSSTCARHFGYVCVGADQNGRGLAVSQSNVVRSVVAVEVDNEMDGRLGLQLASRTGALT